MTGDPLEPAPGGPQTSAVRVHVGLMQIKAGVWCLINALCVAEKHTVSGPDGKSESVSNLQPQASLNLLQSSSPGPKSSGNTVELLKKQMETGKL